MFLLLLPLSRFRSAQTQPNTSFAAQPASSTPSLSASIQMSLFVHRPYRYVYTCIDFVLTQAKDTLAGMARHFLPICSPKAKAVQLVDADIPGFCSRDGGCVLEVESMHDPPYARSGHQLLRRPR
jgi:hypothetical protein